MARIALSRPVAQMCPTPRGPPHQTQLADPDATYLEWAHNCDFVPCNKIAVLDLIVRVLIMKPAPLLFLQVEGETQAGAINPTLADLV
jgi:hypothetical protein